MTRILKIGVVGGSGWLGQTIIKAILDANIVTTEELGLSYRSNVPQYIPGLFVTRDSQALVDACEVIILAVRPPDWLTLKLDAKGKLVISVMAGITLDQLSEHSHTSRVIRALPNVAASVCRSYTPWISSVSITPSDREITTRIFEACGTCDEVHTESDIDYFTVVSGSGPAFPALLAEALRSDAVSRGIAPNIALRAVTELLIGTGRLLEKNRQPPADTVNEFVEYRGIAAAALNTMRAANFEGAVRDGIAAGLQNLTSSRTPS